MKFASTTSTVNGIGCCPSSNNEGKGSTTAGWKLSPGQFTRGVTLFCSSMALTSLARQILTVEAASHQALASSLARRLSAGPCTLALPLPDYSIQPGINGIEHPISCTNTTDPWSLSAKLSDGSMLPSWLEFRKLGRYFAGFGSDSGLKVEDSRAYLTGSGKLNIIDISTPAFTLVSSTNIPCSAANFDVIGNIAYLPCGGSGLAIIDVSDPYNPIQLSSFNTPGDARAVTVAGTIAYISDFSTLQIIDISNPSSPSFLGFYDTPGTVWDTKVKDGIAYIADASSLQVINVTIPSSPSFISSLGVGGVQKLTIEDNVAYYPTGGGFEIIDISNPNSLSSLGSFVETFGPYFSPYNGIAVKGKIAGISGALGFAVVDVSDPSNPSLLDALESFGDSHVNVANDAFYFCSNKGSGTNLEAVNISPDKVSFLAAPTDAKTGSYTVELTQNGQYLDSFDLHVGRPPTLLNRVPDQSLSLNQPYISSILATSIFRDTDQDHLQLSANLASGMPLPGWLSFSLEPFFVSSFDELGDANEITSVAVSNKKAYIGINNNPSLLILDISNTDLPELLSTTSITGDPKKIFIENDLTYVSAATGGLRIFDVSNPLSPMLLSVYSSPSTEDAYIQNKIAYIASYSADLHIVNVTNPSNPTFLSSLSLPGNGVAVETSGSIAYFVSYGSGLHIIDVGDPFNPSLLSSYAWPSCSDVAVVGNIAYLSSNTAPTLSIDVSQPTNPLALGSFSAIGNPKEISVSGDFIFVAAREGGFYGIDFTNSTHPTLSGTYDTPYSAIGLSVVGDYAFLADGLGLIILDLNEWTFTGTPTDSDAGNLQVTLTGRDPAGFSASSTFVLRAEGPPRFANPILPKSVLAGSSFTIFMDQNAFFDPNGDLIAFSAHLNGTSTLPPWLSFSSSGIFTGIPQSSDARLYEIVVEAFDGISSDHAEALFELSVVDTFGNAFARKGGDFSYTLPDDMIETPQGVVTYTLTLGDGANLPSWLIFDSVSLTLSGSPPINAEEKYSILITASDAIQAPVQGSLTLIVEPNFAPQVDNPISGQVAEVNQNFRLVIPDDTFSDPNEDPLTLSMKKFNGRALPKWLTFYSESRVLEGKPGRGNTGAISDKTIPLEVCATDGDVEACTPFDLSVQGTSNTELFLYIAGPLASAAAFATAWYKKRGIFINPWNKKSYTKEAKSVPLGLPFSCILETDLAQVKKVQAFKGKRTLGGISLPKSIEEKGWGEWLKHNTPIRGGALLPSWLKYVEGKNTLVSDSGPQLEDAGEYVILVTGHGDVIHEQFTLFVGSQGSRSVEMYEL